MECLKLRFQSFVMKSQYCDHVKEVKKSPRTLELRSKRLGLLCKDQCGYPDHLEFDRSNVRKSENGLG